MLKEIFSPSRGIFGHIIGDNTWDNVGDMLKDLMSKEQNLKPGTRKIMSN